MKTQNVTILGLTPSCAEQGHTRAQRHLGVCYALGAGVSKDPAKAVEWYATAAAAGEVGAQHNLAIALLKGIGVSRQDSEAVKWLRRAADQDHPPSKFNLGVCYLYGRGVPESTVEAYKWVSLAAVQDHGKAKDALPKIASKMSQLEIAEAKRLAKLFKPLRTLEEGEGELMEKPWRP